VFILFSSSYSLICKPFIAKQSVSRILTAEQKEEGEGHL